MTVDKQQSNLPNFVCLYTGILPFLASETGCVLLFILPGVVRLFNDHFGAHTTPGSPTFTAEMK